MAVMEYHLKSGYFPQASSRRHAPRALGKAPRTPFFAELRGLKLLHVLHLIKQRREKRRHGASTSELPCPEAPPAKRRLSGF